MARRRSSYEQALARGAASSATPRPTRATTSAARDAAAKMAILARLAFGTPVRLDDVRYEGIDHLTGDDIAVRARARPGAEADRHRRAPSAAGSRCACTRRSSTRGHPLASVGGPVQRGHGRVRGDHRDHDVGPGRRRLADRERGARRRRQRDDPAAPPPPAAAAAASRSSRTSSPPSTCTWRSPTSPGVLARSRSVLGDARRVGQVGRAARAWASSARLVMVTHPLPESRLRGAVERSPSSTSCARRRARSA